MQTSTPIRDRREQKAAYRAANKDAIRAYQQGYRAKNPEQRVLESRRYYEKNADTLRRKALAWRLENPEKYAAALAAKRRPRPVKTPEEQALLATARAQKRREARAKYKAAHPEVARAHEQNRRFRKRSAGGVLPRDIVAIKFAEQGGLCVYCQADISTGSHLDHRMPLALGGTNTVGNVQLLCPPCNYKKNAKHPDIFESELRDLTAALSKGK